MLNSILYAILVLGGIGMLSAAILYVVAQKFKVIENPLIDEVAEAWPGADCGGCGFAGCHAFAEAIVNAGNIEGLRCPPGGNAAANQIAKLLGIESSEMKPQVAVLCCNGSLINSPQKTNYQGLEDCRFAQDIFAGEGGCAYGCLGLGNCAKSCTFDALHMDKKTGLPSIDEEKCTACGTCIKACPRSIIEMRDKGAKNRRVFVACKNKEKGGEAIKNCKTACIACLKCKKICPFEAITVENNLAYIDFNKCKLCRKCVNECPTGAILEANFPPQKQQIESVQVSD